MRMKAEYHLKVIKYITSTRKTKIHFRSHLNLKTFLFFFFPLLKHIFQQILATSLKIINMGKTVAYRKRGTSGVQEATPAKHPWALSHVCLPLPCGAPTSVLRSLLPSLAHGFLKLMGAESEAVGFSSLSTAALTLP